MLVARAELNYYPEENLKINEKTRKRVVKKKKKSNSLSKLMSISIATIILLTSLFILFRYAKISATRLEITQLERQKNELEKDKMDLIANLEELKSSRKIVEDARYKLGMDYPAEGQIVYISVEENTNDNLENISKSVQLRKVLSLFSSLF